MGYKIPNARRSDWGEWVKQRRKARNLSKPALAKKLGIDSSYIILMERDGYVPRYEIVLGMALALDTPVDETLLRAGYAPHLPEEAWAVILQEGRRSNLKPELAAACQLHDLTPSEQRQVAAFLDGVLMAGAA